MKAMLLTAGLLLAVLLVPRPCAAQDAAAVAKDTTKKVFTEVEKRAIEEYYKKIGGQYPGQARPGGSQAKEADQDQGKGRKAKEKKAKGKKGGKDQEGLPAGLAKKETLPPGLQKHLERNGTLPPGLQKRILPADLEAKLSRTEQGQERVVVDSDVVLIESATGKVLDVLRNVITAPGSVGK